MSRVKATTTVRLSNGDEMTLAAALDAGRLVVRHCPRFVGARGATREAWFAEEPGTTTGFEVSKFLYLSRAAKETTT